MIQVMAWWWTGVGSLYEAIATKFTYASMRHQRPQFKGDMWKSLSFYKSSQILCPIGWQQAASQLEAMLEPPC